MPTTINADTISGGAVVSGDSSGILSLQSGGNTGLTVNTSLALGVGTGNATGTAGQVLTSSGSGAAPTWAAVNTGGFGTDLLYADYLLTTSSPLGFADAIRMQSVSLDGISELMILGGASSAHAVVFNTSTNTFGTPVLVRTASLSNLPLVALARVSSTSVLLDGPDHTGPCWHGGCSKDGCHD